MSLHRCGKCLEEKVRIETVTKHMYVDGKGSRWGSAHVCPKCKLIAINYKRKEEVERKPTTKRHCRKCRKLLPSTRYFNCVECVPFYESDSGDLVYAAVQTSWMFREGVK